jgi:ketosteroid isomerase-like protein
MDPKFERQLRSAYEAFVAGDFETVNAMFQADALYVNPPYAVESGTRHGTQQLTEVWQGLHDTFEFTRVEVEEVREGSNGIFLIMRLHGRGRTTGAETLATQAHVLRMRDGRVESLHWFSTREEGLRAAGLDSGH